MSITSKKLTVFAGLIAVALALAACSNPVSSGGSSGGGGTSYDCVMVGGTTQAKNGTTGLGIAFGLSGNTDFTAQDYTVSFDVYVPSTTSALSNFQLQFPNGNYDPMYFNTGSIATDQWVTVTQQLKTANLAFGNLLNNAANCWIIGVTSSGGQSLTFYLKNITVTNGSATPLQVVVTPASNFSGNYFPWGASTSAVTTTK